MNDPLKTLAERGNLMKAAIFEKFSKETGVEPLIMSEEAFNKAVISERLQSFTPDSLNAYKVDLRKAFDRDEIDAAGLKKAEEGLNGLATVIIEKGNLKLTRFVRRREGSVDIEKGHKYVKRTGSKGNYKYWYKDAEGKLVSGDKPSKGKSGSSKVVQKMGGGEIKTVKEARIEWKRLDEESKKLRKKLDGGEMQNWHLSRSGWQQEAYNKELSKIETISVHKKRLEDEYLELRGTKTIKKAFDTDLNKAYATLGVDIGAGTV